MEKRGNRGVKEQYDNVTYMCVIDQALGQDGWILALFFFCAFFVPRRSELIWQNVELFIAGRQGKTRAGILPAREANQKTGFASSCHFAECVI